MPPSAGVSSAAQLWKKTLSAVGELLEQEEPRLASLPDSARPTDEWSSFVFKAREHRTEEGPLSLYQYSVKDNIDVAGWPTGAGLHPACAEHPRVSAAVVRKLGEGGATCVGKNTMIELAVGVDSIYPSVRNPKFEDRVTGGSSSGSAAAVAAGAVHFAVGTDSAGSVRVPAAWCGVFGHRPTPQPGSMDGVHYGTPSLDGIGLLSRDVVTLKNVSQALYDYDGPAEWTGSEILTLPSHVVRRCAPEIVEIYRQATHRLSGEFKLVESERLATLMEVRFAVLLVAWAEIAESAPTFSPFEEAQYLGRDTRAILKVGRSLPHDLIEDARGQLRNVAEICGNIIAEVAGVVLPVTPIVAPKSEQRSLYSDVSYGLKEIDKLVEFTALANACGTPATSIPFGPVQPGVPSAMQVLGQVGDDGSHLRLVEDVAIVLAGPRSD